jgi:hypothetical protein
LKLSSEDLAQNFITRYPIFFEDFKGEGLSNWLFYVLYIARRLVIVVCITFIQDATLQLSLSFTMSISVTFNQICAYIISTRSFKVSFYNLFHFSNEILICIFQLSLLFKLLPENTTSPSTITDMSINIITVCWFMNIVVSLGLTLRNLKIKISNYFKTEKVHPEVKIPNDDKLTIEN